MPENAIVFRNGCIPAQRHRYSSIRHIGSDPGPATDNRGVATCSALGAYLGGHSTSTLPLTAAIFTISLLCASTMIFIVPRRKVVVSEALIDKAGEEEQGML